MSRIAVFNGDADGLCALQQLYLAEGPADRLVTGPKRRIALLYEVDAEAGDEVTVLDLSFDVNRHGVARLLEGGASVRYFDHHHAGELRSHPRLTAFIDASPQVCTSVIVDRFLGGRHRAWAVVGAFGDNLDETAFRLSLDLRFGKDALALLRELGIALNYNAYGDSEEDLHFRPADLHRRLREYEDPLQFARSDPAFARLREGYREDIGRAETLVPYAEAPHAAVYVLPDEGWSRRVGGVLASRLARSAPSRAHAVVLPAACGGWQVSVRAPIARPRGASALCRGYESGGGREGAGGINRLPATELEPFVARFLEHFR